MKLAGRSRKTMNDWATLVARHSAVVDEYLAVARRVGAAGWATPIAAGKWTPAEMTSHLTESYRILRGELAGGPGMQLRLRRLHRIVLRYTVLPRILGEGNFPAGARAPRETRPRDIELDPTLALRELSKQAHAFVQELSDRARDARVRLTHAYFGSMSARQSLLLVTVHTQHHARQLAAAAAS
jgi:DinB family protein